jgi:hypothetical protein
MTNTIVATVTTPIITTAVTFLTAVPFMLDKRIRTYRNEGRIWEDLTLETSAEKISLRGEYFSLDRNLYE